MSFFSSLTEGFSTIYAWVSELIGSMLHSTPQGFVGVGLIFLYFAIMIAAIIMRIRRREHMRH